MSLRNSAFAPAEVGEDHVGTEALAPQLQRAGGDALAAVDRLHHRGIEGIHLVEELGQLVAEELHAAQLLLAQHVGLLADADHLAARLRRVMRGEVAVLAREVLVNEEEPRHTGSRIARLRYDVTGASR